MRVHRFVPAGSLSAAFFLGACVTYGTAPPDPVPAGNGVYSIETGAGNASGGSTPSESHQRAIRFCFEQGKQLHRLDRQPGMPEPAGGRMQFRCVGPGEPGWKDPVG